MGVSVQIYRAKRIEGSRDEVRKIKTHWPRAVRQNLKKNPAGLRRRA